VVSAAGDTDEVAWLRLRYKRPGENDSHLIEQAVPPDVATPFDQAPAEARFAAAVAGFGEILRQSAHIGSFDLEDVAAIAVSARGDDSFGYRSEFLRLVRLAQSAATLKVGGG
jgi:Ca-activated chloride channel family protein